MAVRDYWKNHKKTLLFFAGCMGGVFVVTITFPFVNSLLSNAGEWWISRLKHYGYKIGSIDDELKKVTLFPGMISILVADSFLLALAKEKVRKCGDSVEIPLSQIVGLKPYVGVLQCVMVYGVFYCVVFSFHYAGLLLLFLLTLVLIYFAFMMLNYLDRSNT